MDRPLSVANESWWVPRQHPSSLAAKAQPGMGYRAALGAKVDDLAEKAGESAARLALQYLPDLDLTEASPAEAVSGALMSHAAMTGALRAAESGPEADPEAAEEAVEEQQDLELEALLSDLVVSVD